MLRRSLMILAVVTALLPAAFYAGSVPFVEDLGPSLAKRKVHEILFEDLDEPWIEDHVQTTIPCFSGWRKKDIPLFYRRRFPGRLARWLKYRSPEMVQSVFDDVLSGLKPLEDEIPVKPDYSLWRIACRATSDDYLLQVLDITLKQGLLEGVDACLELPGLAYFLGQVENDPWHRKNNRNLINLLEYKGTLSNRKYGGIPWFMKWSGEEILERLCDEPPSAVKDAVQERMNQALVDWSPLYVWPWLPLAYLTKHPDQAFPEYLELYLMRVAREEPCPYMLNAGALFLHIAEPKRIERLLLALRPFAETPRERDFVQPFTFKDGDFLFWFLVGSAPQLRGPQLQEVLQRVLGARVWEPKSFYTIEDMWTAARSYVARYNEDRFVPKHDFYTLMQGLSFGKSPGHWEAVEFTPFLQGHCFMDL